MKPLRALAALAAAAAIAAPSVALAKPRAGIEPAASAILDGSFASRPLTMMALLAALALVPFAVLMLTSFSKIAVVLSIARSALGAQQIPPTIVLTGLAVILSIHIMSPVFEEMWQEAHAAADAREATDFVEVARRGTAPLRAFLEKHAHPEDRAMFLDLARQLRGEARADEVSDRDLAVVVPAFLTSELKEAFQISFLVFLPFLVVDMVIANLLLALGMQSLSPTSVSLPFKLLLFVAVDGWALLARGLVLGYR
jgi:type III secretion protein R